MDLPLEHFLEVCAAEVRSADDKICRFMALRYDVMGDTFPHGVFSVGQATLDFFDVALGHLRGEPFEKLSQVSEYELNYRRWIESNRLVRRES